MLRAAAMLTAHVNRFNVQGDRKPSDFGLQPSGTSDVLARPYLKPEAPEFYAWRLGRRVSMSALRLIALVAVVSFLGTPHRVLAQSATTGSIAGVVRDTTGAVLPGVTVEAASPALIEKVRSVVTD